MYFSEMLNDVVPWLIDSSVELLLAILKFKLMAELLKPKTPALSFVPSTATEHFNQLAWHFVLETPSMR